MTKEDFCRSCGLRDWEIEPDSDDTAKNWMKSLRKRWDQRRVKLNISSNQSKQDLQEAIEFFENLDIHNEGTINLSEFKAFVKMLQAPDADYRAVFVLADIDKNDVISLDEFSTLMKEFLPRLSSKHEELFNNDSPFIVDFFGEKGDKTLDYKEFCSLMNKLERITTRKEFEALNPVDGHITIERLIPHLQEKVDCGMISKHVLKNLKQLVEDEDISTKLKKEKISFKEFKILHDFIKHFKVIEKFIQLHHTGLDKETFCETIKNELDYNLSVEEVDWVFRLFANPSNGLIDGHSFTLVRNNLLSDLPEQPKMKLYQSMLLGGASATVGATTVFPIDKIKTRMQSSPSGTSQSIVGTLREIVKKEGPLKLYRGLQAQLVGITPEKAVKLTVNDLLRKAMIKRHQLESGETAVQLSVFEEMLAGMGTGMVQVIITNPIELIKIRLQMQGANQIESPFTVIKNLGFRGLYTGITATILRDVPFNILYFSSYQYFKQVLISHEKEKLDKNDIQEVNLNAFQLLLASCVAGSIAAGLDTPADGIKTRLQNGQGKYDGIVDCVKQVYAKDGIRGLFRGLPARILIISPLFGITMMCYEMLQRLFFPNTQIGVAILDEDFASIRRSRLRYVDQQLELRYGVSPSFN